MKFIYIGMDVGLGGYGSPAAMCIMGDAGKVLGWAEFVAAKRSADWLERIEDVAGQMALRIEAALSPSERNTLTACIGIEQPPMVKSARVAFQLAYAAGFYARTVQLRFQLPSRLFTVTPSEGKLALSGDGHADKATQVASARLQFRIEVSEHVADAFGVALAIRARRSQLEV